jgi:hypothetical protein
MRAKFVYETLCVQIFLTFSVNQVWAACLNPPASPQAVSQFRSAPQDLVAPNSDTRTIEATTRDLAGTDASLAADLVHLAEGTNPRFRAAIAAGLAQAAIICSTVDQRAARLIQETVAGFEDGQFQASFAAVAGDLSTAATEAASISASSSTGSIQAINPNASRSTIEANGGGGAASLIQFSSPGLSITSLTQFASSGQATNTTASTTSADPVSPTR